LHSLPLFLRVQGRKVVLIGSGEMAEAKARLWRRAGAVLVDEAEAEGAAVAVIALNDETADAAAARMRALGLLVNVVDRPDLCDFTTPAIVERDPVLIAIATGGASAGLAKALRQRVEAMLPQNLGTLASALSATRDTMRARFPGAADRRRALDAALGEDGPLDPFTDGSAGRVDEWLAAGTAPAPSAYHRIALLSADPDDLTLRAARLLGQADVVWHEARCPAEILTRARADAVRMFVGDANPAPDMDAPRRPCPNNISPNVCPTPVGNPCPCPHQGIIVHLTGPC
jgi:uroporphyrin-III C-methyltransferase / precorrin-2 dehydrogenase / sirohydrochlorin ferrochelatase